MQVNVKKLCELILNAGYGTLRQFALAADLNVQNLSNMACGKTKTFRLETAEKIVKTLKCRLKDFVDVVEVWRDIDRINDARQKDVEATDKSPRRDES